MVRQYKRTREVPSADRLQSSQAAIKNNNLAIRAAAKAFKVDRMTLKRFMDRDGVTGQKNNTATHQVFSEGQELELTKHIKDLDNRFYGLSLDQVRQLAYEYGSRNGLAPPENWRKDQKAGTLLSFR